MAVTCTHGFRVHWMMHSLRKVITSSLVVAEQRQSWINAFTKCTAQQSREIGSVGLDTIWWHTQLLDWRRLDLSNVVMPSKGLSKNDRNPRSESEGEQSVVIRRTKDRLSICNSPQSPCSNQSELRIFKISGWGISADFSSKYKHAWKLFIQRGLQKPYKYWGKVKRVLWWTQVLHGQVGRDWFPEMPQFRRVMVPHLWHPLLLLYFKGKHWRKRKNLCSEFVFVSGAAPHPKSHF